MLLVWRKRSLSKILSVQQWQSKRNSKESMICYNCRNPGHIAANCFKGKGKGAPVPWTNPGKGNSGLWNGQWNIGAVQPNPVVNANQTDNAQQDNSIPTWDNSNQQNDADFGGNWDGTLGEVARDEQWKLVMRKARSNRDMRPIRLTRTCCPVGNHIERAGN